MVPGPSGRGMQRVAIRKREKKNNKLKRKKTSRIPPCQWNQSVWKQCEDVCLNLRYRSCCQVFVSFFCWKNTELLQRILFLQTDHANSFVFPHSAAVKLGLKDFEQATKSNYQRRVNYFFNIYWTSICLVKVSGAFHISDISLPEATWKQPEWQKTTSVNLPGLFASRRWTGIQTDPSLQQTV